MADAKDFTITLANGTRGEIKVEEIRYHDGAKAKWEEERMFGVDGHQKIEQGRSVSFRRNLEGIGNATTRFRVLFRTHIGGTKWSETIGTLSEEITAPLRNGAITITLTEPE